LQTGCAGAEVNMTNRRTKSLRARGATKPELTGAVATLARRIG